jgi:hypothetical protein
MRWTGHVARIGKSRSANRILLGHLREGDGLEDPGGDGGIILKGIFKRGWGMDWTYLAHDRDSWWALVNPVMNFRVQ